VSRNLQEMLDPKTPPAAPFRSWVVKRLDTALHSGLRRKKGQMQACYFGAFLKSSSYSPLQPRRCRQLRRALLHPRAHPGLLPTFLYKHRRVFELPQEW
jgi:hypothetical protein